MDSIRYKQTRSDWTHLHETAFIFSGIHFVSDKRKQIHCSDTYIILDHPIYWDEALVNKFICIHLNRAVIRFAYLNTHLLSHWCYKLRHFCISNLLYAVAQFLLLCVIFINSFKMPQNGTLGSCKCTVFARLKRIIVNKLLGIIQ